MLRSNTLAKELDKFGKELTSMISENKLGVIEIETYNMRFIILPATLLFRYVKVSLYIQVWELH